MLPCPGEDAGLLTLTGWSFPHCRVSVHTEKQSVHQSASASHSKYGILVETSRTYHNIHGIHNVELHFGLVDVSYSPLAEEATETFRYAYSCIYTCAVVT